jgi:type II secretory pathway predicted ATPase ExeA
MAYECDRRPKIRLGGTGIALIKINMSRPHTSGEGEQYGEGTEQWFLEHFGLNEQPFGVTPDPRFLHLGPTHRQALAALKYGTQLNRGFLTLIARPGLGKTSLLFSYLEGLRNKARTVFLFQTDCDSRELMSYILTDLGFNGTGKDLPEMHSILNKVLTEEMRLGRRFVLVIDEAQNLTERVLESVRLLSNFETPWAKLMQIVLAGQPQLAKQLANPSMTQLQQRISFAIRIEPLCGEEVDTYISHRLWVAGYKGTSPFTIGARKLIAEHSGGIPRDINNMCFCAMTLGWATKQDTIDREMMLGVLAEMNESKSADGSRKPIAVENPKPAVHTVKKAPARGWITKAAVTAAVLFALGWGGMRLDVVGRSMVLWKHIRAGEISSVRPSVYVAPPAPSTDSSSPSINSRDSAEDKNPGVPQ